MALLEELANFNTDRGDKAFDQFQPSLRRLHTFTDEQMHDHVQAQAGIRLPLEFPVEKFVADLVEWSTTKYQFPIANLPISQNPKTPKPQNPS